MVEESISHGICKECYQTITGELPDIKYDTTIKIVCSWCRKVIFDPDNPPKTRNPSNLPDNERLEKIKNLLQQGNLSEARPLLTPEELALIKLHTLVEQRGWTRKSKFGVEEGLAILEEYYHSLGYKTDSKSNALISPNENRKVKFLARNIQIFKGGRGNWVKAHSLSISEAAANLVQKAQDLFGSKQAVRIQERKQHQKRKTAERRTAAEQLKVNDLISLYNFSANITPNERAEFLHSSINSLEPVQELIPNYYLQDSTFNLKRAESLFTLDIPPLFTEKSVSRAETTAEIGGKNLPIIYEKRDRTITINIGGIPVNPLTGMMDMRLFGGEGEGVVGFVSFKKEIPSAALFMIMSGEQKRQGVGRHVLRAFCQAIAAYGAPYFVAVGVGEEGSAFFERLHNKGEITILHRDGKNWLITCQNIMTPNQQTLFKV